VGLVRWAGRAPQATTTYIDDLLHSCAIGGSDMFGSSLGRPVQFSGTSCDFCVPHFSLL